MSDNDPAGRAVPILVNGTAVPAPSEARVSLLDLLRDAGWTGTHAGCEHGVCGACTVLLDGEPVRSCLVFGVQAQGHAVETVEGLGSAERPHPLQVAFSREDALQCGFCTPGFLVLAAGLLRENHHPSTNEVREAMSANLCRCTSYAAIVRAVERATRDA